jgi:hypothetical protein
MAESFLTQKVRLGVDECFGALKCSIFKTLAGYRLVLMTRAKPTDQFNLPTPIYDRNL